MTNFLAKDQITEPKTKWEHLFKYVGLHTTHVCTIPAGVKPAHIGPKDSILMAEILK